MLQIFCGMKCALFLAFIVLELTEKSVGNNLYFYLKRFSPTKTQEFINKENIHGVLLMKLILCCSFEVTIYSYSMDKNLLKVSKITSEQRSGECYSEINC